MATRQLGRNAACKWATETTWGTAVSRTNSGRIRSASLARVVETVTSADLLHAAATYNAGIDFQSVIRATGQITMTALYEGLGMWLRYAIGKGATTGSGPYTHTYTNDNSDETNLVGMTVELLRGKNTDATSAQSEVFNGALPNTFEFACNAGEEATITLDLIGRTAAARGSAGSLSLGTRYPILHSHGAAISWNSETIYYNSLTLRVNNNLETEQLVGSLLIDKPTRGMQEITLSVTMSAEKTLSDALYAAYLAGTQADLSVAFTDSVNSKSFTITLHNAKITEHADAVTGPGKIPVTLTWKAYTDLSGTDYGISLAVVNAQSDKDN